MLKYKKLSRYAYPPQKKTEDAAGFDLYSPRHYIISPQRMELVPLDISIQLPKGCYGRIAPRSGVTIKSQVGIGAGVIDPDFRGNVGVVVFNHNPVESFVILPGDRIAQLICEKFVSPELMECEELDETERGDAGFGSTGVSLTTPTTLPSSSLSSSSSSSSAPVTSTAGSVITQQPASTITMTSSTMSSVLPVKRSSSEAIRVTNEGGLRFIFDFEGFFCDIDDTLVIKEIAFTCVETNFLTSCFLLKSPYNFENLSESKRELVSNRTKEYHGIDWSDGDMTADDLIYLLYTIIPFSSTIYAPDALKCQILREMFPGWKVKNLATLGCPSVDLPFSFMSSSKLPAYNKETFKICNLPAHKELKEDGELRYECALGRVQKFRAWYRNSKRNLASCWSPFWRSQMREHAYCCYLKCFDRYDNPTEVDGLACVKCLAYSCCHCACKTHMFAKNYRVSQVLMLKKRKNKN